MLGAEKRVRALYGGEVPEEKQKQPSSMAPLAAYLALLLAFIGLVFMAWIYNTADLGRMGTIDQTTTSLQNRMDELTGRVSQLEDQSGQGREAVINSMINEIQSRVDYLTTMPMTSEQRENLNEVLSTMTGGTPTQSSDFGTAEE